MSMRQCLAFLLLCVLVTPVSAQVQLRGGRLTNDSIVAITPQGVEVGGTAPRIISWDRVQTVEGEFAEDAAAFASVSDLAWRARTRLARGDIMMAQPLFEELFEQYRDSDGPLSLMIAEGLLQCRLANLAQSSAVEPWLVAMRLRRAGVTIAGERPDASMLDAELFLAPQLPPIWLEDTATSAMVLDEPDEAGPRAALARLYARAQGADVETITSSDDAAVSLVIQIIAAGSAEASTRADARQWLRAGLSRDEGTWKEAWRRAAIGRSFLLERSSADRRRGMVQLLHVPARFGDSQRYLAGVCLALVADALEQDGDTLGAAAIHDELVEFDSTHPALQWLNRRQVQRSDETGAASTAHKERS